MTKLIVACRNFANAPKTAEDVLPLSFTSRNQHALNKVLGVICVCQQKERISTKRER
jgi:hypothetical protein